MNIRFDPSAVAVPERYHGEVELDAEQCIGCGLCEAICPNKALKRIKMAEEYQNNYAFTYPLIDSRKCSFCALCQDICPVGAIRLSKNVILASLDATTLVTGPLPNYAA